MELDTTVKFFDERGELIFLPSVSDSLIENILGKSVFVKRLKSFDDIGTVAGGLYDRQCFINRYTESFAYGQYKLFIPILYKEDVKQFKKLNPFKSLSSFFSSKSQDYLKEIWSVFVEYKDAKEENADILMNGRYYKIRFRYIDFEDDVDNLYNCGTLGLYNLFSRCTPLNKRVSSNFDQIARLFSRLLIITPINKRSRFLNGSNGELPYISKAYEAFGEIEDNLKAFVVRDDVSLIDKASACASYCEAYNDLVYRVMRGYFDFDKKNWTLTSDGKLKKRLRLIPHIVEDVPKDTLIFSKAMLYRILKEEIIFRLMSMGNIEDPFKSYLLGENTAQEIFREIVSTYSVAVSKDFEKNRHLVVFKIQYYERDSFDKFDVNGIGCSRFVYNSFKNCKLFSNGSYTFFKENAETDKNLKRLNANSNWFYNTKATFKSTVTLQSAIGLFKCTTSVDCNDDMVVEDVKEAKDKFSDYELNIDKLVSVNGTLTTVGRILLEERIGINPLVFNNHFDGGIRIKDLHKIVAYTSAIDKTGVSVSSLMDYFDSCSVCDSMSIPHIKTIFKDMSEDGISTIDDIALKSHEIIETINNQISELPDTIESSKHDIYGHTIHISYDGWEILDTLQIDYTKVVESDLVEAVKNIKFFTVKNGCPDKLNTIKSKVGHSFFRTSSSGAIINEVLNDEVHVYSACARKDKVIFEFEKSRLCESEDMIEMSENILNNIKNANPKGHKFRAILKDEFSAVEVVDGLSTLNTLENTTKVYLSESAAPSHSLFKGASGENKLLYSRTMKAPLTLEYLLNQSFFSKERTISISPVNGVIEYIEDKGVLYCGDIPVKINEDFIYFFENKGEIRFGDTFSSGITTYRALRELGLKDTRICELLFRQMNNFGFFDLSQFEFELVFKACLLSINGEF